jgi:hypothetical protein
LGYGLLLVAWQLSQIANDAKATCITLFGGNQFAGVDNMA